jgi:DNA-binding CsgD family transcriptional regulator/DNA-binding transcriptional ArsR family regulator
LSPLSFATQPAWRSGEPAACAGQDRQAAPEPATLPGGLAAPLLELRELLAGCQAGAGSAVVLSGPVASGKSTLLHALCADARASGVPCLTAIAARSEQDLPLGVVGQLMHSAELPSEQIRAVLGRLGAGPLAVVDGAGDRQVAMHVVDQLGRMVFDLARHGPLLLAVDDVQHADPASLQFLLFLTRRIRSVPVLVVLTESTDWRGAHPAFLADLSRQPHVRRLALRWLSRREVAGTLADRIGRPAADRHAADAYAATGGNPMLLRALLDDHPAAGGTGQEIPRLVPGEAFRRAVIDFLYRGKPEVLRVAGGAAVLAEAGSVALLPRLLDLDADTVGRAVHSLQAAGLLTTDGRFRGETTRAAVLAGLAAGERAGLHRRAARLLHWDAAPAAVVAQHLLAGGGTGEPWSVPVLTEAAEEAVAHCRPETALTFLELAERAALDDRQRAAVAALLLAVRWRFSPSAVARNLTPLVAALQDGQLPARSAAMVARLLLWLGRGQEAAEALGRMATVEAAGQDAESLDEIRTLRTWMACTFPPLAASLPPEPETAEPAVPLTLKPRLHAVTTLSSVLTTPADAEAAPVPGEPAVAGLRGTWLTETTLDVAESAVLALIYSDRLAEAAASCDALLAQANGRPATCWQGRLSSLRAMIAVRQGQLVAAQQLAAAAVSILPPPCWGVGVGEPLSSLVLAATAMGRGAEAAGHLDQPVPEAMFQSRFGLHYLHARGDYHLATGRPRAALGDFLACGSLMVKWGMDRAAMVPWRTEAARALTELDRQDEAREYVVEQLARLDGCDGARTRGLTLRQLAAVSAPRQRPRLLREAVEVLQASGDRLQLAHALADLGHANRCLGEASRARTMIRQAWHIARECGAESLCRLLVPRGGRPSAAAALPLVDAQQPAPLSDAERRVAALAALGRTNREIAGRLYITVSTVEQHLTRVYRKLNVRRRADLPSWLLSDTADSA